MQEKITAAVKGVADNEEISKVLKTSREFYIRYHE